MIDSNHVFYANGSLARGAVAEWVRARSLNPEVPSSNPTDAVSNLGQVRLPHVALMTMNVCVRHVRGPK